MTIGIIGAGAIGTAVARTIARAGIPVIIPDGDAVLDALIFADVR